MGFVALRWILHTITLTGQVGVRNVVMLSIRHVPIWILRLPLLLSYYYHITPNNGNALPLYLVTRKPRLPSRGRSQSILLLHQRLRSLIPILPDPQPPACNEHRQSTRDQASIIHRGSRHRHAVREAIQHREHDDVHAADAADRVGYRIGHPERPWDDVSASR